MIDIFQINAGYKIVLLYQNKNSFKVFILKENVRTFLKTVNVLCDSFLFYHKTCFPKEASVLFFLLWRYVKDCALFK